MRGLVPIGRALFALIFVTGIFNHFSRDTIAYASAHGVPLASIVVPLTGILALVGGVMVLLGYRAKFGAFLLLLFLVPVTLIMHDFWSVSDPQAVEVQKAMFMKNTGLIGCSLLIMYWGSGPYSLDD